MLAGLKGVNLLHALLTIFSNGKEPWFYAVVEFLPTPKVFYGSLSISQNYGNMMVRIQGGTI